MLAHVCRPACELAYSRVMRVTLLCALSLAACGSSAPPATAPATATAPPTAAATATASVASAECLPLELRSRPLDRRPSAPVDVVGTIVAQRKPTCLLEVHDSGGKVTSTHTCSGDDDPRLPDLFNHAVCEIGGEVSWIDGRVSDDVVRVEVHVGRYAKHDELADVALICAPFSTWKDPRTNQPVDPSFDAEQRRALRGDFLEVAVTSPTWRRWVHHAGDPAQKGESLAALLAAAKRGNIACDASWLTASSPSP